jgi:hypothetical protein
MANAQPFAVETTQSFVRVVPPRQTYKMPRVVLRPFRDFHLPSFPYFVSIYTFPKYSNNRGNLLTEDFSSHRQCLFINISPSGRRKSLSRASQASPSICLLPSLLLCSNLCIPVAIDVILTKLDDPANSHVPDVVKLAVVICVNISNVTGSSR